MNAYRQVNLVLLVVGTLLCTAIVLGGVFRIGMCPGAAFGRPCCLCGCTHDFLAILRGDFAAVVNPLSAWLFPVVVAEFVFRLWGSFRAFGPSVLRADIALHAVVFAVLAYCNLSNLIRG